MKLSKVILTLLCMLSIGACKEDYTYPNVFVEFTEVTTDAQGKPLNVITDRGDSYRISNELKGNQLVADTLYRMYTIFEPVENTTDELYVHSLKSIISDLPITVIDLGDEIKTDPVDIQSIWRAGRYLNMILPVMTKDTKHIFHFIEENISENPDGSRTLHLLFYHDRCEDVEAFTTKYLFSIPLWPYEGRLRKGDHISLTLNTYKAGMIVKEYPY